MKSYKEHYRPSARNVRQKLKPSDQDKSLTQQQIRRCICDCPLDATINFGGQNTCTYHARQDYRYWREITMSINDNMDLIKQLRRMIRWTSKDWTEQYNLLSEFQLCPMTESDYQQPTIYLNKFSKALRNKILNESSDHGDWHA